MPGYGAGMGSDPRRDIGPAPLAGDAGDEEGDARESELEAELDAIEDDEGEGARR